MWEVNCDHIHSSARQYWVLLFECTTHYFENINHADKTNIILNKISNMLCLHNGCLMRERQYAIIDSSGAWEQVRFVDSVFLELCMEYCQYTYIHLVL